MHIGTGIYVKNSAEAVELYKAAFGLELGYHVKNPDGSYFHSELMSRAGLEVFDVIERTGDVRYGNIIQLYMILDTEKDLRHAYELLSEGGAVEMTLAPLPWSPLAAVLTDKFGVNWYLSLPQHMPDDDFDPTQEYNTR